MNEHKSNDYVSIKSEQIDIKGGLMILFNWNLSTRFHRYYEPSVGLPADLGTCAAHTTLN